MTMQLVRQAVAGNSGVQTAITVNLGGTAAAGNLLLSCICSDKTSGAYTAPSGFTPIFTYDSANVSGCYAYKLAYGAETNAVWSQAASSANGLSAWLGEFAGQAASAFDLILSASSGVTAVKTIAVGPTANTAAVEDVAIVAVGTDTWNLTNAGRSFGNNFSELADVGSGSGPPGLTIAIKSIPTVSAISTSYTTTGTGDQMWIAVAAFKSSATAAAALPVKLAHYNRRSTNG